LIGLFSKRTVSPFSIKAPIRDFQQSSYTDGYFPMDIQETLFESAKDRLPEGSNPGEFAEVYKTLPKGSPA
jgi:hypothetical protein